MTTSGIIVESHVLHNAITWTEQRSQNGIQYRELYCWKRGWKWRWSVCGSRKKLTVGFILCQNGKPKCLYGNILVLKLIEMAVLFVSIYQSVACARTTQQLQQKIQIHQTYTATWKTKHPWEYDLACQASKKKQKASSSMEKAVPTFTLLDSWEKQWPLCLHIRLLQMLLLIAWQGIHYRLVLLTNQASRQCCRHSTHATSYLPVNILQKWQYQH